MSAESRVAFRYAKSLVSWAQEKGKLNRIKDDAALVIQTLADNRDLTLMLRSPIIPGTVKLTILTKVFSKHVDEVTLEFFKLICGKKREKAIIFIFKEVLEMYYLIEGVQLATLITSEKVDTALSDKFENVVKQISGRQKVQLTKETNKELIGGFVLKIGGRQIDASVSTQLKELKLALAN